MRACGSLRCPSALNPQPLGLAARLGAARGTELRVQGGPRAQGTPRPWQPHCGVRAAGRARDAGHAQPRAAVERTWMILSSKPSSTLRSRSSRSPLSPSSRPRPLPRPLPSLRPAKMSSVSNTVSSVTCWYSLLTWSLNEGTSAAPSSAARTGARRLACTLRPATARTGPGARHRGAWMRSMVSGARRTIARSPGLTAIVDRTGRQQPAPVHLLPWSLLWRCWCVDCVGCSATRPRAPENSRAPWWRTGAPPPSAPARCRPRWPSWTASTDRWSPRRADGLGGDWAGRGPRARAVSDRIRGLSSACGW